MDYRAGAGAGILTTWSRAKMKQLHNNTADGTANADTIEMTQHLLGIIILLHDEGSALTKTHQGCLMAVVEGGGASSFLIWS